MVQSRVFAMYLKVGAVCFWLCKQGLVFHIGCKQRQEASGGNTALTLPGTASSQAMLVSGMKHGLEQGFLQVLGSVFGFVSKRWYFAFAKGTQQVKQILQ